MSIVMIACALLIVSSTVLHYEALHALNAVLLYFLAMRLVRKTVSDQRSAVSEHRTRSGFPVRQRLAAA